MTRPTTEQLVGSLAQRTGLDPATLWAVIEFALALMSQCRQTDPQAHLRADDHGRFARPMVSAWRQRIFKRAVEKELPADMPREKRRQVAQLSLDEVLGMSPVQLKTIIRENDAPDADEPVVRDGPPPVPPLDRPAW